jgi:hypothetical protein
VNDFTDDLCRTCKAKTLQVFLFKIFSKSIGFAVLKSMKNYSCAIFNLNNHKSRSHLRAYLFLDVKFMLKIESNLTKKSIFDFFKTIH